MSVQTEIDRIITAVNAAHEKVAEKGGTTAQPYLVGNLASAIDTIPDATEPTLQSKTVSPSTSAQTVKPDSGYDGLSQVTVNAMTTATQATPSIIVSTDGKITASATQTAGYVAAGTKTATKQLTTQAAQTITPGTSNKTISSGRYLTGTQTIKGDANLVAGNIKSGVSIFGVAGSYEGSGGSGGNVETCTVSIAIEAPTDTPSGNIYYTTGELSVGTQSWEMMDSVTITPIKGSVITMYGIYGSSYAWDITGDAEMIEALYGDSGGSTTFAVNGDCSITYNG